VEISDYKVPEDRFYESLFSILNLNGLKRGSKLNAFFVKGGKEDEKSLMGAINCCCL
jgi:hypothetical protein